MSRAACTTPDRGPRRSPQQRWAMRLAPAFVGLAAAAGAAPEAEDGALARLGALDTSGLEPRVAGAIDDARRQVRAQPHAGFAWGRLGAVLDAHDLRGPALDAYAQARALEPGQIRWTYNAGVLEAARRTRPEQAVALLRSALDIDPGYAPAYYQLGLLLTDLGRYDAAIDVLQAGLRRADTQAAMWRALGRAQLASGALDAATTSLRQARALAPDDAATALALGQALHRRGDAQEAAALIEAARRPGQAAVVPDALRQEVQSLGISAALCSERATRLLAAGRADEAITQLEIVRETKPDDPYVLARLGMAHLVANRRDQAEAALNRALVLAPDLAEARVQLGRLHLAAGDVTGAVEQFELVLAAHPEEGLAHAKLAVALVSDGRPAAALPHFQQAQRLGAADAETLLNWAITLHDLGDAAGAADLGRAALNADPDYAKAHYVLGVWAAGGGAHAAAIGHYRAALALAPGDVEVRVALARSAAAAGDPTTAIAELREVQRLAPGHSSRSELQALERGRE